METLDTNHDGILSAEEIANAPATLKKLDKNGDGQLTEEELRPPPPGGRGGPPRRGPVEGPASIMQPPAPPGAMPHAPAAAEARRPPPPRLEDDPVAARLDRGDQDKGEPAAQPPGSPRTLFDLLDTNHDGKLSEDELRNAPAVLKQLDLKSVTINRQSDPQAPAPPLD